MDTCGGRAKPYHFHTDLNALVAVALDGRGIYGRYESTGALPSGLDACNGHYGEVPVLQSSTAALAALGSAFDLFSLVQAIVTEITLQASIGWKI